MADKIRCVSKRPGGSPRSVNVTNSLENLQNYVGGFIETLTIAEDLCIICNEEGRIKGLPYNCTVCGVELYGDILFVSVDGDAFSDLPCTFAEFKAVFRDLWEEGE